MLNSKISKELHFPHLILGFIAIKKGFASLGPLPVGIRVAILFSVVWYKKYAFWLTKPDWYLPLLIYDLVISDWPIYCWWVSIQIFSSNLLMADSSNEITPNNPTHINNWMQRKQINSGLKYGKSKNISDTPMDEKHEKIITRTQRIS